MQQRGAAVQSTENNAETRLDLEAIGMRAEAAKQARDYSGNTSRHRAITNEASAEDVPALIAALAAERDRADRAEATIAHALEWAGKVGGDGAAYEILSDHKASA